MTKTLLDFTDPQDAAAPRLRWAFGEPRAVLIATQLDQVATVLDQVQQAAEAGSWCVGMVAYEAAAAFDSALHTHPPGAYAGPLAWFAVHDAPMSKSDDRRYRARTPSTTPAPALVWVSSLERAGFDSALSHIAQAIAAGDYYQANFTAPLIASLPSGGTDAAIAGALFEQLQSAQPDGYAALVPVGDAWVLSVSPELFFDWDSTKRSILTRPMKGTAARGTTPQADAAAEAALQSSSKERAENVMVVDLLRNDLSRIAQSGSVEVPRLFHTQALPTVWQMTSDVRATTRADVGLVDVFRALFPCGSVTGAPKAAAMHALTTLEASARGVYCGGLGVVRPDGQGGIRATFNVPIRTVELRGGKARCGIGSGITAGSQPEGEWQEWQAKRAFLDRASGPFELLETLALVDGSFRHAGQHLERMAASAVHFGFEWNAHAVRGELQILALQHLSGHWRVRLLLAINGGVRTEAFELHQPTAPILLQLATCPLLQAHGDFVRHKTTRRAHYDAFTPHDPDIFDTILFNAAGEITECTRGNIAALVNGRWVTPPLKCGLLPGVGRALALQEGRLEEAVLRREELGNVQAWAFLNSLRGWLDAVLVPSV